MKKITFRKLTKKQILKTILYSGSIGVLMFLLTSFLIGCEVMSAHPEDYPSLLEEMTFYGVAISRAHFLLIINICFTCIIIFFLFFSLLRFLLKKLDTI